MSKDSDQTRKDTSYSPASETETQAKQAQPIPPTIDADAAKHVNVAPGTGGPDDPGDVDIDDTEINLPPYSDTKPGN